MSGDADTDGERDHDADVPHVAGELVAVEAYRQKGGVGRPLRRRGLLPAARDRHDQ
jgi:hypothetical protein